MPLLQKYIEFKSIQSNYFGFCYHILVALSQYYIYIDRYALLLYSKFSCHCHCYSRKFEINELIMHSGMEETGKESKKKTKPSRKIFSIGPKNQTKNYSKWNFQFSFIAQCNY